MMITSDPAISTKAATMVAVEMQVLRWQEVLLRVEALLAHALELVWATYPEAPAPFVPVLQAAVVRVVAQLADLYPRLPGMPMAEQFILAQATRVSTIKDRVVAQRSMHRPRPRSHPSRTHPP